jgi:hypothetical protein
MNTLNILKLVKVWGYDCKSDEKSEVVNEDFLRITGDLLCKN